MFSPLDGIRSCSGGEGLRLSSTHCSGKPFSNSCISKIYVSAVAVVMLVGGVVHVILVIHCEMGVAVILLGGKGESGEEDM